MKQFTDRTHPRHTRNTGSETPVYTRKDETTPAPTTLFTKYSSHQLHHFFHNFLFTISLSHKSTKNYFNPKQNKKKIPAKSIGHLLGRHVHVHEWFRNVASNRDHHPLIWHEKRVFYVSANCTLARTFIAYAATTTTKTLSYNHIHLPRHTYSSSACLHLPPLHPSHIVTPQHAASSSSYTHYPLYHSIDHT